MNEAALAVSLWHAVAALVSTFVALTGLYVMIMWRILARHEQREDERNRPLMERLEEHGVKLLEHERNLLEFKAELPKTYVMRDDWVRFGATLDAKLDVIRDEMQELRKAVYGGRDES